MLRQIASQNAFDLLTIFGFLGFLFAAKHTRTSEIIRGRVGDPHGLKLDIHAHALNCIVLIEQLMNLTGA